MTTFARTLTYAIAAITTVALAALVITDIASRWPA